MTNPTPTLSSDEEKINKILIGLAKRVYFNGSTDVIARKNGVIPNDTKLGEVQIAAEVAEARTAIKKILVEARIDEWQQLQDENKPPCVTTYKQQRIAELEKQLKD